MAARIDGIERRLAAILAADVVGYSRLMSHDEEGTLRRVKALLARLIRPSIETHRGRLVKTTGDGVLAEFASVVEAFHCAMEIQEGTERSNAGRAPEQRMDLRIGINVGDIMFDAGDVFGDGVNIAARLEQIAKPGSICVSQRAWEDLRKLNVEFEDMGEQQLKNIGHPIRAYTLDRPARSTVYSPGRFVAAPPAPPVTAPPAGEVGPTAGGSAPATSPGQTLTQTRPARVIAIGDVLNHSYEVTRRIGRGGMGEVFEGRELASKDRVAIKVIRPELASDERVVEMFRKEAQALTRLRHPAIVQYRGLAQDPHLDVLYIVTEYIDGPNLAQAMGGMKPTETDLADLLRLLASGLASAHNLKVIHRDLSPDNVLLGDGKLDEARIIDFGIVKDMNPDVDTIIGDGFAGKLNNVAPEQLGDFGGTVGPWTDVYSLGLIILGVAAGREMRIGGTFCEALDKRRAGIDLAAAPEGLRPVLEAMLRPDPEQRLRSMREVIEMLDGPSGRIPAPAAPPPPAPPPAWQRPRVLIAAAAAVLLAAVLTLALVWSGDERDPAEVAQAASARAAQAAAAVDCSWLDTSVAQVGDRLRVGLSGVARDPGAATTSVSRSLDEAGLPEAVIQADGVERLSDEACQAVDGFRGLRSPGGDRLSMPSKSFAYTLQTGGPDEGKRAAAVIFTMDVAEAADFMLLLGSPSGDLIPLISGKEAFLAQLDDLKNNVVKKVGPDKYELNILVDHIGLSNLVLVTGDLGLAADAVGDGEIDGPAIQKIVEQAKARNGKAEMVWFKSVPS